MRARIWNSVAFADRSHMDLHSLHKAKRNTVEPSCERPSKMPRFRGGLREVVAYGSPTTRGLFREEVRTHLTYGREFLACNSLQCSVPCLYHQKFFVWSEKYSTFTANIEIRPLVKWPGRLQEFNNNENCKNSYSKSGGGKSRPLTKGGRFIREARFQL